MQCDICNGPIEQNDYREFVFWRLSRPLKFRSMEGDTAYTIYDICKKCKDDFIEFVKAKEEESA